jgi:hypothetical protein
VDIYAYHMTLFLEPTMNAPTLARPLRLTRPWPLRAADDVGVRLVAWARALRAAWQRRRQLQRERAELDAAADLSDATLRDMGAPDWLRTQAHGRRESHRFERELLRLGPRADDTFRYY